MKVLILVVSLALCGAKNIDSNFDDAWNKWKEVQSKDYSPIEEKIRFNTLGLMKYL